MSPSFQTSRNPYLLHKVSPGQPSPSSATAPFFFFFGTNSTGNWTSQVALVIKTPPASGDLKHAGSILDWKDPLEEGVATHSSILAWRIPWTEQPEGPVHGVIKSRTRLKQQHNWELTAQCLVSAIPAPLGVPLTSFIVPLLLWEARLLSRAGPWPGECPPWSQHHPRRP